MADDRFVSLRHLKLLAMRCCVMVNSKITELTTAIGEDLTEIETNAKAYADGLAGNYDSVGSAETAERNAKAHANSLDASMNVRVEALENANIDCGTW